MVVWTTATAAVHHGKRLREGGSTLRRPTGVRERVAWWRRTTSSWMWRSSRLSRSGGIDYVAGGSSGEWMTERIGGGEQPIGMIGGEWRYAAALNKNCTAAQQGGQYNNSNIQQQPPREDGQQFG